jgi:hypothetical protein
MLEVFKIKLVDSNRIESASFNLGETRLRFWSSYALGILRAAINRAFKA